MPAAKMNDILRACIAYHEAGHAVHYFVYDFGVDFCSIDSQIIKERYGIDAAGGANRMRRSMDASPKGLEIELDGQLVGTTAERIFLASQDPTQFSQEVRQQLIENTKQGAKTDCKNFNAILDLPAFKHLTEADKKEHRATSPARVSAFVHEHAEQINALALALYERGTLNEVEITAILTRYPKP